MGLGRLALGLGRLALGLGRLLWVWDGCNGSGTVGVGSGTVGVGSGTVGVGSGMVGVGSGTVGVGSGTVAMGLGRLALGLGQLMWGPRGLFGYQHVGISNAKVSPWGHCPRQSSNARGLRSGGIHAVIFMRRKAIN